MTTNATPHERFFIFQRRSTTGMSLPSWMTTESKAFMKRFVRHSKSDPFVDKVEIIHVNPNYAQVRCPNGREITVSLRNLAQCPQEDTADEEPDFPLIPVNDKKRPTSRIIYLVSRTRSLRRAAQMTKAVPPLTSYLGVYQE